MNPGMANSNEITESELVSMESGSCGASSGYGTQKTVHIQPAHREEKKERVKQCLREIKSLMPQGSQKKGVLGTLQQVVQRMKQIKETDPVPTNAVPFVIPHQPLHKNVQQEKLASSSSMSDALSFTDSDYSKQESYQIVINSTDSVVVQVSDDLTDSLDYPRSYWNRQSLLDFIRKSDLASFTSSLCYCRSHSKPDDKNSSDKNKIFFKIRHYKSLREGFNLLRTQRFSAFCGEMSIQKLILTQPHMTESPDAQPLSPDSKEYIVIQCKPLQSGYPAHYVLPEKRSFMTKHTKFCNFSEVEPAAIALLGYLPQDLINTSVFNCYHPDDLPLLFNIYQLVLAKPEESVKSAPFRLRCQNGSYVVVDTTWFSSINRWTKSWDSITCHHTVIQGPDNIDVFADVPLTASMKPCDDYNSDLDSEDSGIDKKIQKLFLQPFQQSGLTAPSSPAPVEETAEKPALSQDVVPSGDGGSSDESGLMSTESFIVEAIKLQEDDDASGSIQLCDNDVSVLYEGLSYASNIRRFLMGGVSPSDMSDGQQNGQSGSRDSPEEDLTVDVELPLPARIRSYASSTKALVSEHEREELPPSPAHEVDPATDEANRESSSSEDYTPVRLTMSTLKVHDKLHERDFIQKITKERAGYLLSQTGTKMLKVLGRANQKRHQQDMEREEKIVANKLMKQEDGQAVPTHKSPVSRGQMLEPIFPLTTLDTRMTSTLPGVVMSNRNKNTPQPDSAFLSNGQDELMPPAAAAVSAPSWSFPHIQLASNLQNNTPVIRYPPSSLPPGSRVPSSFTQTQTVPSGANHYVGPPDAYWSFYSQPNTVIGFPAGGMYNQGFVPRQPHMYMSQMYGGGNSFLTPPQPVYMSPPAVPPPRTEVPGNQGFIGQPPQKGCPASSGDMDYTSSDSSLLYLLESSTNQSSHNNSSHSEGEGNGTHGKNVLKKRAATQNPAWKRPLLLDPDPPWKTPVNWNHDLQMSYTMPGSKGKDCLNADLVLLHQLKQPVQVSQQLDELLRHINTGSESNNDDDIDFLGYGHATHLPSDPNSSDFSDQLFMPRRLTNQEEGPSPLSSPLASAEETCEDTASASHISVVPKDDDVVMESKVKEGEAEIQQSSSKPSEVLSDTSSCELGSDEIRKEEKLSSNDFSEDGSESSKSYSDITPSDNRSNEEALSSLKESDNCSSSSSNGYKQNGTNSSESEIDVKNTIKDREKKADYFSKLFVPLKVKSEKNAGPWLEDANFTEYTQLQYQQHVPSKEDILFNDQQMLMRLSQPQMVQVQMSYLVQEMHGASCSQYSSSSSCLSSSDQMDQCTTDSAQAHLSIMSHLESDKHKDKLAFMDCDVTDSSCNHMGRVDEAFSYESQSATSGGKQNNSSQASKSSSSDDKVGSLSSSNSNAKDNSASLSSQDNSKTNSSSGSGKDSSSNVERRTDQSSSDQDLGSASGAQVTNRNLPIISQSDCNNPPRSYPTHNQSVALLSTQSESVHVASNYSTGEEKKDIMTFSTSSPLVTPAQSMSPGMEDLHSVMSVFTLEEVLGRDDDTLELLLE